MIPGHELLGGFSRAFDLIASEYGYSEESLHDLTLARIRQCVAAITERKTLEDRKQKDLIRWQTRNICFFVANTLMIKEGSENTLAKLAQELTFRPQKVDPETLTEEEQVFGKKIEPTVGSYERFQGVFGVYPGSH